MELQPFIVTPEDYQPALNVIGTKVIVLASNEATRSQQVTLQSGDEGMGPPPHNHDWDESFYVLKGKIEFNCAGKSVMCMPGTLVHVPAGTVHSFSYGPGGGEMLEITGEGSNAIRAFTEVSEHFPPEPPDIAKVAEVFKQNGIVFQA
jgi:quercetin dioxygenase-like cupin family protein